MLRELGIGNMTLHISPGLEADIEAQQRGAVTMPVMASSTSTSNRLSLGAMLPMSAKASAFMRCM